jgi:hypothetical protein
MNQIELHFILHACTIAAVQNSRCTWFLAWGSQRFADELFEACVSWDSGHFMIIDKTILYLNTLVPFHPLKYASIHRAQNLHNPAGKAFSENKISICPRRIIHFFLSEFHADKTWLLVPYHQIRAPCKCKHRADHLNVRGREKRLDWCLGFCYWRWPSHASDTRGWNQGGHSLCSCPWFSGRISLGEPDWSASSIYSGVAL